MTPEPPSEQAPYPTPIPDWLEKRVTPTPEQEREELLRLTRIIEKDRAEAKTKAAAVITPEEREQILEACREIVKEEADAKTKAEVQARIQTRSEMAKKSKAAYWATPLGEPLQPIARLPEGLRKMQEAHDQSLPMAQDPEMKTAMERFQRLSGSEKPKVLPRHTT